MVIQHVVLFKFKPTTTEAEIDDASQNLAGLKELIPGMDRFIGGPYSSPEGLNQGYTHGFIMTFGRFGNEVRGRSPNKESSGPVLVGCVAKLRLYLTLFSRLVASNPGQAWRPAPLKTMNSQLVAIAGPRRGTTLPMPDLEVSIGRDADNWLVIESDGVSRRHCLLTPGPDGVAIADLESLNGTFVNGVPVKRRLLHPGDVIGLGDTLLLFAVRESEPVAAFRQVQPDPADSSAPPSASGAESLETEVGSSTVQFDVPAVGGGRATVRMSAEELLYLAPESLVEALPSAGRVKQDMQALLGVASAIGSKEGLEALEQRLLDAILEVVPAERAAIFLIDDDPDEFFSIFGRGREGETDAAVQVSRPVIHRVLREGTAVLGNDFPNSKYAAGGDEAVQAVLAVPLTVIEKVRGVIYLETADPSVRFDEHHLQLLSAVGSVAAMPLESARRIVALENENRRLQREINIEHDMVGEAANMRKVYDFIAKAAPTAATVLVTGESGTGKELVARAMHANSPRAEKPFMAINCAALTETLLESELFGHEKGAFTGAVVRKKGKLEVAHEGTVFLDEIGEMAPPLQAKLLRVLQDHRFDRVGGTKPVSVDIRVIAATNRDLMKEVGAGNFREDLYYRLNVVSIRLPALRERREDIPLLAQYFLKKHSQRLARPVQGLSRETQRCLAAYDWQGNVRELENAIERAVVLGSTETILPEDLPEAVLETRPAAEVPDGGYHEAVNEAKKRLILAAVGEARGSFTEAAKALGLHPNYLHRLVRNLDLRGELTAKLKGSE